MSVHTTYVHTCPTQLQAGFLKGAHDVKLQDSSRMPMVLADACTLQLLATAVAKKRKTAGSSISHQHAEPAKNPVRNVLIPMVQAHIRNLAP